MRKRTYYKGICCLAFLLPLSLFAQTLKSPEGDWQLSFTLERGKPMVKVYHRDEVVMPLRNVGLTLVGDSPSLDADFMGQQAGASAPVPSDEYREMSVNLFQRTTARQLTLHFRLSEGRACLRYEFPDQNTLSDFTILFDGKPLTLHAPAETPWLMLTGKALPDKETRTGFWSRVKRWFSKKKS